MLSRLPISASTSNAAIISVSTTFSSFLEASVCGLFRGPGFASMLQQKVLANASTRFRSSSSMEENVMGGHPGGRVFRGSKLARFACGIPWHSILLGIQARAPCDAWTNCEPDPATQQGGRGYGRNNKVHPEWSCLPCHPPIQHIKPPQPKCRRH